MKKNENDFRNIHLKNILTLTLKQGKKSFEGVNEIHIVTLLNTEALVMSSQNH